MQPNCKKNDEIFLPTVGNDNLSIGNGADNKKRAENATFSYILYETMLTQNLCEGRKFIASTRRVKNVPTTLEYSA